MGTRQTGRIAGLDGIRALAVLAVFAEHRTPLRPTEIGHIGVLAFFALSGFLIVGILHAARERIEQGRASLRDEISSFFYRRMLRVFPPYYAVLAILAALAATGVVATGWRWDALPWHLAYLSNVYLGQVYRGWQGSLSHLWSLSVEEQFYLIAAPLLLTLPSRHHVRACVAVVGLGLCSLALHEASGARDVTTYTDSLAGFACIALGGYLRLKFTSIPRTISGRMGWAALAALLGLSLLPRASHLDALAYIIAPIAAATFVLSVANAQQSRLVALLELRPIAYLGQISYGFYLYHNLFWLPGLVPGRAGNLIAIGLNLGASIALAAVSYHAFERPLMQLGRRRRVAATPAVPEAVSA